MRPDTQTTRPEGLFKSIVCRPSWVRRPSAALPDPRQTPKEEDTVTDTDTARALDGITPENIINPPTCTSAEFIANNPRQAVRTTFNNLWEAAEAMARRMRVWRSLSITGQWALENVHDAVPCRMAGATRACLIRKGLIQDTGAITLLGREAVYEGRRSDQITRRIACRYLAEHPEQATQRGAPAGCCTTRIGPIRCSCECHQLRRCTTASTVGRFIDPKVQAYAEACIGSGRNATPAIATAVESGSGGSRAQDGAQ